MDRQVLGGWQENGRRDVLSGVPEVQQNRDSARIQAEGGKGAMEPLQVGSPHTLYTGIMQSEFI